MICGLGLGTPPGLEGEELTLDALLLEKLLALSFLHFETPAGIPRLIPPVGAGRGAGGGGGDANSKAAAGYGEGEVWA